ncbi:MAG: sulfatase [Puniceicoccaceae bacterium]
MKHILTGLLVSVILCSALFGNPSSRPNVVLIVCDDLNDFVSGMGGHPQAQTPNMAKLASSGVAFKRAYSNNPVCAPSRSSFLTGIYGHVSGNLFWGEWFKNPVLQNSKTIMEHFKDNGYHVAGSGKLMHHRKQEVWSEFKYKADYGPFVYDGENRIAHPSVPKPYGNIGAVDGSYAILEDIPFVDDDNPESGWIYGDWGKPVKPFNPATDPTPDERNAAWAASKIKQFAKEGGNKPFFLGIGFIRPHTPLHVSKKYYDMYPLETLQLPVIQPNDAEDTYYKDIFDPSQKGLRYYRELKASYPSIEQGLRVFTQAYLACVTAVDECIGEIVDAVDNSPFKDNTIIIVTSDHGWNMGEKDYIFKNSPWEESCRIPFIVRAPGIAKAGTEVDQPISLIDLYPTLVDLCGLEGDTRKNSKGAPLSGHSVRPLLENPKTGEWTGPEGALSMIWAGLKGKDQWNPDMQHWSLRTERWRYVRYNTGDEELYDHDADPYEWNNLAKDKAYKRIKESLHKQMLKMRSSS